MKIIKQSVELIGLTIPVYMDGEFIYAKEGSVAMDRLVVKGASQTLLESAGRTCYKSEDKIDEGSAGKFIELRCKDKHESVLEHASASFRVICDRGVSHEIVRHRLCSYSQESTRYCNYSKDKFGGEITVIKPPGLIVDNTNGDMPEGFWYRAMEQAEKSYMAMIQMGVPPQIARSVLPTCLKTELVWTANLREWLHILKLRTAPAAHPQMREVAGMIKDILVKVAPSVFKEYCDGA